MFNDLNYSSKYFCVSYSRSLIYLSRSNPCSRLCAMFITYTWKCATFLFDFVLFYLAASCKEMYLGLCDKRCSHDFIRLVCFFFNFSLNYLAEIECSYSLHWVKNIHLLYGQKTFFWQFLFWNLLESCHVPDFQGQKKGIYRYMYLCTKLIENEVCFVELQGRLHVCSDMTWKCSIASRLIDCHCPWTKFRRN